MKRNREKRQACQRLWFPTFSFQRSILANSIHVHWSVFRALSVIVES